MSHFSEAHPMNKEQILREIKRTAEANGGVPLGMNRFRAETGIKESDWKGKYWPRWGDALLEAGYVANEFGSRPYTQTELVEKYAQYAQALGRLPAKYDISLKRRTDSTFPSYLAFQRRWSKAELVARVREYCRGQEGCEDVAQMCAAYAARQPRASANCQTSEEQWGSAYLLKSGRFFKIGRTNASGRREYELDIQLPEKVKTIRVIRTDDPGGIEAYWHKRFEAKRKKGEWFELGAADVAAFKRRKFM